MLMAALFSGSAAFAQIHKDASAGMGKDSSVVSRTYNLNPIVVTGSGHHQRLRHHHLRRRTDTHDAAGLDGPQFDGYLPTSQRIG